MTNPRDINLTRLIKEKAAALDFDLCGIAPVRELKEFKKSLKKWIETGMNGNMDYIARSMEKRTNPGLIVNGAKSLVVVGLNYFTTKKQGGDGIPVISRYAYGIDYHCLIKGKLEKLFGFIIKIYPKVKGQSYVDFAPIMEKAWAREAGLGWFGKNSLLLNKEIGSFFFIGILVLNIVLEYDNPFTEDYCGNCRLCIDSCPTQAINNNRTIDARRCISYLTVENKSPIPEEFAGRLEYRVFGCDKCQEVCPWNKNVKAHKIPELDLPSELANMTRKEWLTLPEELFQRLFNKSAVKRVKYKGLIRNINFISG